MTRMKTTQQDWLSRKWLVGPVTLGLAVGLAGTPVQAQPPGDAMGDNPPARQPRGDRGGMTPEQREQAMQRRREQREQMLRRTLTNAGFTEQPLQDAIVAYVNEEATATQPLQEKARQLQQALRNQDATDVQVAALLADFRAAVEAEVARREAALAALEAKIGYTQKPRLDALLTLSGIIGDEASVLGMGGGMGMGGFGGPGGRGGAGAGQGGRGGQGRRGGANDGKATKADGQA